MGQVVDNFILENEIKIKRAGVLFRTYGNVPFGIYGRERDEFIAKRDRAFGILNKIAGQLGGDLGRLGAMVTRLKVHYQFVLKKYHLNWY